MRIIYKTKKNQVVVVQATSEWLGTIEDLAKEVVPTGVKYKIVEDSVIPNDRTFRDAWEVADKELTDGVGA
tara:strand:- start:171 stop:383 length:213 start_codon:yes stop_codon:yes gene_type:complete